MKWVSFLERFRWDSLWGGIWSGQVTEVLQAFQVGGADEVAAAPVGVESELGGEGVGVGVEAVLVAALGEGDGAAAYDRAGVSKLGDLGLADFGVGGEQHHLMASLRLVGLNCWLE